MGRLGRVLAGAVAMGLVGWAGWVEPRRFVVRRRVLRPPGWPAPLDGLRVGVLADPHAGGPHVAAAPEAVARALATLSPPLGRVAVLGNHDWTHTGQRMRAALRATGTRMLEDEAVTVGRGLWVAGVGDERERGAHVGVALAGVPAGAPVLLLTHDPDVFPRVPARVSLTLAGHLHGAQVDLPGVRRPFVPSRFGTRYLHGLVQEDGRLLLVTSGLGQAGLPLRLRRPPEAWVLELRAS